MKLVKAGFPIEKVPKKYREKVKALLSKSGFLKEDEKNADEESDLADIQLAIDSQYEEEV